MFRSFDLSYSEQRPDNSRYAYSVSASYYTPAPADVELDKAIANFAALGLNGVASMTGPMGQFPNSGYLGEQYSQPSNGGRVQDPPYPGCYAGSMANGYYGQGSIAPTMQPSSVKAIDYPRSMINAPSNVDGYSGSRVSSSRHHNSSRRPRPGGSSTGGASQYYQDVQRVDELNNSKAMVKYAPSKKSKSKSKTKSKHLNAAGGGDAWDEFDDVEPEDSISQVSSRMSSRYSDDRGYDPRERTRRRDGSVMSRSTVVPGRGQYYSVRGGGNGGGEDFYYTKEVTPW